MSQALRKLTGGLNSTNTTMIFINQLREKIGVFFGSPETTAGGKALKFYASVRLDIRRIETLKDGTEAVGNRTRVKVVKNKMASPFKQAEFDIIYGIGISREGSLIDFGVDHDVDLGNLIARDFGNSEHPDSPEGEETTMQLAKTAVDASKLAIALGGDNSVTYAAMRGSMPLETSGLITFDAHHDLRDGVSNGSPVRRLVEAGLPGNKIVQIGINDFSNSPAYAQLAKDLGVLVITRAQLRTQTPEEIWQQAMNHLAGVESIHVDIDVDVCDRSVVPACPAAAPGGISADELRQFAFLAGKSSAVKSLDITEIDATADSADQRTIRLAALLILEAATGLALRK
jgi:formiminoglutamase